MLVIGLSGLAGVGKSTVADILQEDYGFEKRSFAAPIKAMLRKLDPTLGWGDVGMGPQLVRLSDLLLCYPSEDDLKHSEYGDEYRRLMQVLGTDCVRAIDPQFWVKAARWTLLDPDGKYVFDDVRFPNEASMIYEMSAYKAVVTDVWQVTRPGVTVTKGAHVSEQWAGRMEETVEIMNNLGKERLRETVGIAMEFVNAPVRWMEGMPDAR